MQADGGGRRRGLVRVVRERSGGCKVWRCGVGFRVNVNCGVLGAGKLMGWRQ